MTTEQQLKALESVPSSALKEMTQQTDLFGDVDNVTEYSTTEAIPEDLIQSNTIDSATTTQPIQGGQTVPNYGNVEGSANFAPVDFISPALAVSTLDTVLPMAVALLVGMVGYEINAKSLKMNASERKLMEEPTKEVLATLNIKMSPWEKFFVCLASIYGAKALEIINNGEYQKKGKKRTENALDKDYLEEQPIKKGRPKGRRVI